VPSLDYIEMPPFSAFKTAEGFYCTELHECTHSSGHESRLDRNLTGRFGTRSYAAEELVAELGAAFLAPISASRASSGMPTTSLRWVELLKRDNKAIFTVCRQGTTSRRLPS
jgi:antirestriction protein ArdC